MPRSLLAGGGHLRADSAQHNKLPLRCCLEKKNARSGRGIGRSVVLRLRQDGAQFMQLLKHITCLRFLDIPLYIVQQKEPLPLQFLSGPGYGHYVSIMILVTLLERKTWIAGRQPLCLSGREGDVLTIRFTTFVLAKALAAQCPAGGGGNRCFDRWQADAGQFVTVGVHLRDKDRIGGTSCD